MNPGSLKILPSVVMLAMLMFAPTRLHAQAGLPIYTDHLVNGFQDWSWGTRNFANTTPVHSGSNSISASLTAWQAVSLYHPDFSTTVHSALSFWVNGGARGGQRLQVVARLGNNTRPAYQIPALPTNAWLRVVVPLSSLGAANARNLTELTSN